MEKKEEKEGNKEQNEKEHTSIKYKVITEAQACTGGPYSSKIVKILTCFKENLINYPTEFMQKFVLLGYSSSKLYILTPIMSSKITH
jgi:hypothetical protein